MTAAFDRQYVVIEEERTKLLRLKGQGIQRLVVHVQSPADAQHIASCRSVEDLELWGWKAPDFQTLKNLPVKWLRLVRGRQTSLDGLNTTRLKMLWLQVCPKISEVNLAGVPWLSLDACNNFDLDSLGRLTGMIRLGIACHKVINSLSFVTRCRSLRCLEIGTYSLKTRDFLPLIEHPALEILFFGRLRQAEVEAISAANPKLFVGSAVCLMLAGRKMTKEDFFARRTAFEKKHGLAR